MGALASTLGGDEDDPIRATGPIDSGGRRILENFNGRDVVGVDGRQWIVVHGPTVPAEEVVLCDGNAIHHIERVSRSRDGGAPPDPDQTSGTGHA